MRRTNPRFRRRLVTAGLAGALALAAACGDDGDDAANGTAGTAGAPEATAPAPPDLDGVVLSATLSGAEAVPGPGVADGVGMAEVTFGNGQLCYDLSVTMGETPTAAHIHEGAGGETGPVVVDFDPDFTRGESAFLDEGCVDADPAVLAGIGDAPEGYYVNVHTAEHPAGALRGQLAASAGDGAGGTADDDTTTTTRPASDPGYGGY